MTTYRGSIKAILFHNKADNFGTLSFAIDGHEDEPIRAVGILVDPQKGARLEIDGEWVSHPKHGAQFKINRFSFLKPESIEKQVVFLGSGLIHGLGLSTAAKIVEKFGDKTFDILDKTPERLLAIPGIGQKKLDVIIGDWKKHRGMREAFISLQAWGVPSALAVKIYDRYKELTIPIISANPYKLAEDVWGIGFVTADKIAQAVGIKHSSQDRIDSGIIHVLQKHAENGHTCMPRNLLCTDSAQILGVPVADVDKGIDRLVLKKKCFRDQVYWWTTDQAEEAIFLAQFFFEEAKLVQLLKRLRQCPNGRSSLDSITDEFISQVAGKTEINLSDSQSQAVAGAIHNKISILSGGPGTGKTTTLRVLVQICELSDRKVLLVSPTGRAAKRLASSTESEASTVHRALGFSPEGKGFIHNDKNPLDADIVICDEASMLDTHLAVGLLNAIKPDAHLLLVGDPDQLPSVGAGNVLNDLIRSKALPITVLKEVRRQAADSAIIGNAHRINNGEMPIISREHKDFFFLAAEESEKLVDLVAKIVTQWGPKNFGFDPIADTQVLAPMRRGPAGIAKLNDVLRNVINPMPKPEIYIGGNYFRQGDKVIQIINDYNKAVYNGDIGQIISIDKDGAVRVLFDDGRIVAYEPIELDQLLPAFAISVHKSQGSEFPLVVVAIDLSHRNMLQRNLLYTAVTRAKKIVVLVGSKDAMQIAINNNREARRYTGLFSRIQNII